MATPDQFTTKATLEWLLEKENPSVRYFALKKLFGKNDSDKELIEAKKDIMKAGIVPRLLQLQNEDGSWGDPKRFYHQKYSGTVWQLIILAEMGADTKNPQLKKAGEFILNVSQDIERHAFAYIGSAKKGGGSHNEVIPCLTGNMIFSLIKFGFLDDDRVQHGIDWICKYQRTDDGDIAPQKEWPYHKYEMCWGKHTCHMGVVKSLKALAAIPEEKRNSSVKKKIKELAEYMLLHHVYKKNHNFEKISKPGWTKFGFPLMYQSDALEITGILTDLGYRDPRMTNAIELIKSRQNADGRWLMQNTFNGKMVENVETKGKPSKWITLKALHVLMNN